MKKLTDGQRIVHVDIETMFNIVAAWRCGFKLNIGPNSIISERYMLGFSWIWEGEDKSKIKRCFIPDTKEGKKDIRDDSGVIKQLFEVLDEADVVVAYNGDRFDIPWFNGRALMHGVLPPSYYRTIDLYKVVKNKFGLNSNKLEYVNKVLGFEGKDSMCFQDWMDCWNGNLFAFDKMGKYCDRDVLAMRETYHKIRGWIHRHVPIGDIRADGVPTCNACGKTTMIKYGYYPTAKGRFQRMRCTSCGHTSNTGKNLLSKEQRDSINRNCP